MSDRTLRVVGLGHTLTLELDATDTIGSLKERIEKETMLPAIYQRLLTRGKKLDNNDASTLSDLGIEHRTKLMLLHNEYYAQDKEGIDALSPLIKDIAELEKAGDDKPSNEIHELVTQICCKLDGVEANGSERIRALRKQALMRAQAIDKAASG
eukprot:CAMPEP_0119005922 /NCGR_PEP_ID=MMETSP1176-20130426/2009_1 /TAXON_ID=265551 /ORGANISM="Synedropsis recta cf, Strain CCMP1620" /LENGTH=153 /DNA_ID=CAMNT_0006957781 /DNA_START=21 /DNA_END=482 /DNA_ORIENTATION=+